MPGVGLSIRWWLGIAFALIAAVTAGAVAWVFSSQANDAFRERAKELVAGTSFVAAEEIVISVHTGIGVQEAVENASGPRGIGIVLLDRRGGVIARGGTRAAEGALTRRDRQAVARALDGHRVVRTVNQGREVLVAMPLRSGRFGALLVHGTPPELSAELGIVRDRIIEAALWAVVVGALAGLFVSALISMRLRRIAAAASAIAEGDFEHPLRPRFNDEVGALATTVNRMRERLQESFAAVAADRDRLHTLLDRLPEGVLTIDRDLFVLFANREAGRLVPGVRAGQPLPDVWDAPSLRELARDLFAPDAEPLEQRFAPEGDRAYEVIAIPAPPRGEYAIVVLTDVSERERLEQVEREFVANASHELRTPLTTITGAVEALQSGAKDDPRERDRFVGLIEREASRLARLVRALLVLARAQTQQEPPRSDAVAVTPLLDELAGAFRTPDVEVVVESEPAALVLGDPDLLEQVLRNLVENAVKFTERGTVRLRAERIGRLVRVVVADEGRGIDPRSQRRIFERFHREGGRDAEGFGLGLAIVRQGVRVLGGRIALSSQPGAGTTFTITLPAADTEELAA